MLTVFITAIVLAQGPAAPAPRAAAVEGLIARAVAERMGNDVTVSAQLIEPADIEQAFESARPDPMGRVGGAMMFTLIPAATGARVARVRARVEVIAERVQARHEILRGHVVAEGDVDVVRGPLAGVPVRRLPQHAQIVGEKALRPIAPGQVIEEGFVAVRRAVQAGDTVTVIAVLGPVQVTASFVASDSGDPGDVVRVVNRETRRSLRARVVRTGVVEVIYET